MMHMQHQLNGYSPCSVPAQYCNYQHCGKRENAKGNAKPIAGAGIAVDIYHI